MRRAQCLERALKLNKVIAYKGPEYLPLATEMGIRKLGYDSDRATPEGEVGR